MDKKYQVFVSSTYTDLAAERQEVMQALLELSCIPVGMELFQASDDDQWSLIKRLIDDCDYYIVIIAGRYGSTDEAGISYTQKEYEYALTKRIPIIGFVHKDPGSIASNRTDADPVDRAKLESFKILVQKKVVKYWVGSSDLGSQVSRSLVKLIKDKPGIGWIKADKAASPEVSKELALLSKENRELKLRIQQFEALEEKRLPNFKLYINNSDVLKIQLKNLSNRTRWSFIEPLRETTSGTLVDLSSDTPQTIVTSRTEQIRDYNAKIAENFEEVAEYNKKVETQFRISNNHVKVEFAVGNTGSQKANELYVEITFPQEILIYEELPNKEELVKPKNIPPHPYDFPVPESSVGINSAYSQLIKATSAIINPNRTSHFRVKDNQLTIRIGSLLHNLQKNMTEPAFLVPLRTGVFKASVLFLCEELKDPIESTFEIEVLEQIDESNI